MKEDMILYTNNVLVNPSCVMFMNIDEFVSVITFMDAVQSKKLQSSDTEHISHDY